MCTTNSFYVTDRCDDPDENGCAVIPPSEVVTESLSSGGCKEVGLVRLLLEYWGVCLGRDDLSGWILRRSEYRRANVFRRSLVGLYNGIPKLLFINE